MCVFVSSTVLIPPAHYTLIHSVGKTAPLPPFPHHTHTHSILVETLRVIHTLDIFQPRGVVASVGEPMSAGMVVGATGQVSFDWRVSVTFPTMKNWISKSILNSGCLLMLLACHETVVQVNFQCFETFSMYNH